MFGLFVTGGVRRSKFYRLDRNNIALNLFQREERGLVLSLYRRFVEGGRHFK